MWEKLSGFEQMVMDFVWANPGCTADDCSQDLAEASRPVKEFIGAVLR